MRYLAMIAAGAIVIAASVSVNAAPLAPTGLSPGGSSPIVQVQEKKKDSTVTKMENSVKRAWKKMVGYKFNVSCLLEKSTCTETGKDRDVARGKCQAAHPLCMISDSKSASM